MKMSPLQRLMMGQTQLANMGAGMRPFETYYPEGDASLMGTMWGLKELEKEFEDNATKWGPEQTLLGETAYEKLRQGEIESEGYGVRARRK